MRRWKRRLLPCAITTTRVFVRRKRKKSIDVPIAFFVSGAAMNDAVSAGPLCRSGKRRASTRREGEPVTVRERCKSGSVGCAIVILGASGDLAKRKLMPALHELYRSGRLDDTNIIIGEGRSEFTDDTFRDRFEFADAFRKRIYYHRFIPGLKKFLTAHGTFERVIFFLALLPKRMPEQRGNFGRKGSAPRCRLSSKNRSATTTTRRFPSIGN